METIETAVKKILKKNFKKGKDYLLVDYNDYIIVIPLTYEVFGGKEMRKILPLKHCVTMEKEYFDSYYKNRYYQWHWLKCFFLKKNTPAEEMYEHLNSRKEEMSEFTCWIDLNEEKSRWIFDSRNVLVTGYKGIYIDATQCKYLSDILKLCDNAVPYVKSYLGTLDNRTRKHLFTR